MKLPSNGNALVRDGGQTGHGVGRTSTGKGDGDFGFDPARDAPHCERSGHIHSRRLELNASSIFTNNEFGCGGDGDFPHSKGW